MNYKKIAILFCVFINLFLVNKLLAQPNSANRNITVPTTASIGVSWDAQVSMYSGAANINIPLYNIEDYSYNLPINLTYSYSGLKYSDYASIVGLHWNLSIPIITRNIVDKDDFNTEKGYYYVSPEDRNKEKSDMPDIFTLYCPEGTVKFFFPYDNRSRSRGIDAEIFYDNSGTFNIFYDKDSKSITVKSIKGNIYNFDVFVNTKCQIKTQPKSTVPDEYYISTWYPSKITLPNNKNINFSYISSEKKLKSFAGQIGAVAIINPSGSGGSVSGFVSESEMSTDEILLSNVDWNDGTIVFNYIDREDLPVQGTIKAKRLSSIEVSNKKNEKVNIIKLISDYFPSLDANNKRLRLSKIQEFGNSLNNIPEEYSFEYDNQVLPNYNFLPRYFGYDSVRTNSAALISVKFPTGLTTKFLYERNEYNSASDNSSKPDTKHLGARVSSISSYDRNGMLMSKKKWEYKYENGLSSGLVLCRANSTLYVNGLYFFTLSNNWYPPIYQSEIIGYSTVLEYETSSNSEVVLNGGKRTYFYNQPTQYNFDLLGAMPNYNYKNGQINSEVVYKGENKDDFKEIKTNTYSDVIISSKSYDIKVFIGLPGSTGASQLINSLRSQRARMLVVSSNTQSQNNETQYVQESQLFQYSSDVFNDYRDFLPIKKIVSQGSVFQKALAYKYPHDFRVGRNTRVSNAVSSMSYSDVGDKSVVIEELLLNKQNEILGGTINDFISGTGYIYSPRATFKLMLSAPLSDTTITAKPSVNSDTLAVHPNYIKSASYLHSNSGNLVQIDSRSNVKLTYVWGYNNLYPIAEIQNTTYADVVDVLGQSTIDNLNSVGVTDAIITSALNTLRNSSKMKNALISGYIFRPLMGMVSKTDPRGISESYEKDGFHRLIAMKNDKGDILKSYVYNRSNVQLVAAKYYNKTQTKTFRKNDCTPQTPPTVAIGSEVTYTVDAGKYISAISQEDADQKALDEINRKGQAHANKYGTCTYAVFIDV